MGGAHPALRKALLIAAAGLLLLVSGGCEPSAEKDFSFQPLTTTNEDFDDPVFYDVGNAPTTMATVDLNNDGYFDIAVVNQFETLATGNATADISQPGTITFLINDGLGAFTSQAGPEVGIMPGAILFGNFDGNAFPDFALIDGVSTKVTIYLNDGSDTWSPGICSLDGVSTDCEMGGTVAMISLIDFNGDGSTHQDIIVSLTESDTDMVSGKMIALVNDGSGGFTLISSDITDPDAGNSPTRFISGSWNGDIYPDLAVLDISNNRVSILLGAGDGTFSFTAESIIDTETRPHSIVQGDFNNDGNSDLIISNASSYSVTLLMGDGQGLFSPHESSPITLLETGSGPERMVVGNFTPAGLDVAVVNRSTESVSILNGDGTGEFIHETVQVSSDPFDLSKGDFNGDGIEDLVVTESRYKAVSIITGKTGADFERTLIGFDNKVSFPTVLDINNDNLPDILLLHRNKDKLILLVNCHPAPGIACP